MKPFTIAIAINLSMALIAFLMDFAALGNYDWAPVQVTLLAFINLLLAGFFLYDKRPKIALPFGFFMVVMGLGCALLWKLYFDARMEMGAVDPQYMEAVWPIKRGY
jgi:hypothetical protein